VSLSIFSLFPASSGKFRLPFLYPISRSSNDFLSRYLCFPFLLCSTKEFSNFLLFPSRRQLLASPGLTDMRFLYSQHKPRALRLFHHLVGHSVSLFFSITSRWEVLWYCLVERRSQVSHYTQTSLRRPSPPLPTLLRRRFVVVDCMVFSV